MDLYTFELVAGITFSVVMGLGVGMFAALNNSLQDQIKGVRSGLKQLTTALGFEYSRSWHSEEIYISFPWGRGEDKTPASRGDVERFFAEHEERLNAVYKHLGIKVEKKITPAVAEKKEVVVSKVSKN